MATARETIVKGPAIAKYGGNYFYSEQDIDVPFETQTDKVDSSLYGKVDEVKTGQSAKPTFTPIVMDESSLAITHACLGYSMGQSLFGSTDKPLEIWSVSGKKLTFACAAITKVPSVLLASKGNPYGELEFTCVRANGAEATAANSFVTITNTPFVDPATLNLKSRLRCKYTASWAGEGSAWAAFTSQEGFTFECDLTTDEDNLDGEGLVDVKFGGIEVRMKCVPIPGGSVPIGEPAMVAAMALQGAGAALGTSLSQMPATHDLVVVGSLPAAQTPKQLLTVTLKGAAMKTGGSRFGRTVLRDRETGWIATSPLSSGVVAPYASIVLS